MMFPLRLLPDDDLRRALEHACAVNAISAAFVVAGIGSLIDVQLRFAGHAEPTTLPGPAEILTLSGSLAANGAQLHMSIATAAGAVFGGHVAYGNRIRTTVELLVAALPEWQLQREHDAATGYAELVVRKREPRGADVATR